MEASSAPSQAVETEDRTMPVSGEDTSAGSNARSSSETAGIDRNSEAERNPTTSDKEISEKHTARDSETAGRLATSGNETAGKPASSGNETAGKPASSGSEIDGKPATIKTESEEKSATSNETAKKSEYSSDETDGKSKTSSSDETDGKSATSSSEVVGKSVAIKNKSEGIPATGNNETDATRSSDPEGKPAVGVKTEGQPGESQAHESGSAQDAASEVEFSGSEISGDFHRPVVFIYAPPKLQQANRYGNTHANSHAGGFKSRTATKPLDTTAAGKSAASASFTTSGGRQQRSNPTVVKPERGGNRGDASPAHGGDNASAQQQQQRQQQRQRKQQQQQQQLSSQSSPQSAKKRQEASSREKPAPSSATSGGGSRRGDGGSARSRQESDDDTNIYKRELQAVKMELRHLKESVEDNGKQKVRQSTSARSKRRIPLAEFNATGSYCDTQFIDFYMKKDSTNRYYPVSKRTATTLVDPWDELAMQKPTERVKRHAADRRQAAKRPSGRSGHESRAEESSSSPHRASSPHRRATPLPVMDFNATAEYWRRPVSFVELPEIRARIRELHTASGSRRRQLDYARASEECHSLELDSFERVPSRRSRRSLARSCSAYLAATPGSRAAVGDCLERSRRLWYDPAAEDRDELEQQQGEAGRRKINYSTSGRRSAKA